jgi:hypothetical protein
MTDFSRADGLDELRGQHGIALDTLFHHETRGNVAQRQRHTGDDQKAAQGKPAQQVELPPQANALCYWRIRQRRYLWWFEYLHGRVPSVT